MITIPFTSNWLDRAQICNESAVAALAIILAQRLLDQDARHEVTRGGTPLPQGMRLPQESYIQGPAYAIRFDRLAIPRTLSLTNAS